MNQSETFKPGTHSKNAAGAAKNAADDAANSAGSRRKSTDARASRTDNPTAAASACREDVLAQFGRNLPRHLIGVARAFNERVMNQSQASGHAGLRASFNQVLCRLSSRGTRIVDIANSCRITQQAAGQIVGELEKLGYVKRKPDSSDKRAKQLILTAKGERLMADCDRHAAALDTELNAALGAAALAEFRDSCARLYQALLDDDETADRQSPHYLLLCLSGLAVYCEQQLMELDKNKGHSRLKMSFSQVISHISPHGSLINDLARINGVSKQAISQVVKEVEDLGYIARQQNPDDARSTKLFLTDYGMQLIEDSVINISVLREQFVRVLRERKVKHFAQRIEALYDHFCADSARLLDTSQRLHVESALQNLLEQLYRDEADSAAGKTLFSRSGARARLSAAALELIAAIEIRTDK